MKLFTLSRGRYTPSAPSQTLRRGGCSTSFPGGSSRRPPPAFLRRLSRENDKPTNTWTHMNMHRLNKIYYNPVSMKKPQKLPFFFNSHSNHFYISYISNMVPVWRKSPGSIISKIFSNSLKNNNFMKFNKTCNVLIRCELITVHIILCIAPIIITGN